MDEEYEEVDEVIENETIITILTLGEKTVGKTSFVSKYSKNTFSEDYSTTILMEFKDKRLEKNDKNYILRFIDPPTLDTNTKNNLIKLKFDGIIFLYDTTNQESFKDISKYIEFFQDKKGKNFPMILLGNKIDKEADRQISKEKWRKIS